MTIMDDMVELSRQVNVNKGDVGHIATSCRGNKDKITGLEEHCQGLAQKIEENKYEIENILRNGPVKAASISQSIKYEMPTFKASSGDKPARFIKSFLDYMKVINATRQNFKHVISQALQGPALEWWEHIEPIIDTVEQFRSRFLGRYWNSTIQSQVRRDLEFGYYRGRMGVTRSEYVLSLYNDVRMLNDMPNIGSIIDKFSRHLMNTYKPWFYREVYVLWTVSSRYWIRQIRSVT